MTIRDRCLRAPRLEVPIADEQGLPSHAPCELARLVDPQEYVVREGKIHPVVAERLPLPDARRAHELLERTAATGKLVLVS